MIVSEFRPAQTDPYLESKQLYFLVLISPGFPTKIVIDHRLNFVELKSRASFPTAAAPCRVCRGAGVGYPTVTELQPEQDQSVIDNIIRLAICHLVLWPDTTSPRAR